MTSNGGLVAGGIVNASNDVLSGVLQSCAENGEETL